MRINRPLAAVLISGLAAATVFVAMPAVADDASCPISASIPSKVAYAGTFTAAQSSVSDPNGCLNWVDYQLIRSDGTVSDGNVYDATHLTSTFDLGVYSDGPGRFHLVFDEGYSTIATDDVGDTAPLAATDSGWLTAKYASRITWRTTTRAHGVTSLKATVKRYSPSNVGFVPWKGATVTFQAKKGAEWVTTRTVRTDSKGVASARISTGKHIWRAVSSDSSTIWGAATGVHTR